MPVLVVGAGIVGASVAYHLARLGAAVTLIDRAQPGSGVTGASFAWIGASGEGPAAIATLRASALREYRRLEVELPGLRVRWTGSLAWTAGLARVSRGGDRDQEERLLGVAAVREIEPNLRTPPAQAVFRPSDGAVDPTATTHSLVQGARERGADVVLDTAVTALWVEGDAVLGVETSAGFLPAHTVVLANGVDAPALCAPLGISLPVGPSPALLLRFTAPTGIVKTIVASPEFEAREASDGQLLVTTPWNGERTEADLAQIAERTRAAIAAAFNDADGLHLVSAHVGQRPMPVDGAPIVGPVPLLQDLYVTVMHSAVTLAPLIGRLAAQEIVDERAIQELQGCRITRFLPSR